MSKIYKSNFTIHKSNPDGSFEGYANVFNEIDNQLDCVQNGAFLNAIRNFQIKGKYPGMYYNHNLSKPLGKWTHVQEDSYGLYVRGQLLFDLPMAREVHSILNITSLGLSVGIEIIKSTVVGTVRYIYEVILYEISLTEWPANKKAKCFIRKNNDNE